MLQNRNPSRSAQSRASSRSDKESATADLRYDTKLVQIKSIFNGTLPPEKPVKPEKPERPAAATKKENGKPKKKEKEPSLSPKDQDEKAKKFKTVLLGTKLEPLQTVWKVPGDLNIDGTQSGSSSSTGSYGSFVDDSEMGCQCFIYEQTKRDIFSQIEQGRNSLTKYLCPFCLRHPETFMGSRGSHELTGGRGNHELLPPIQNQSDNGVGHCVVRRVPVLKNVQRRKSVKWKTTINMALPVVEADEREEEHEHENEQSTT